MLKLERHKKLIFAGTISALIFTGLAACTSGPDPNAKKALMACYAVTNVQAGQILGRQLDALMLSGEKSPIHVCKYNDTNTGETPALLQISETDSKDPTGELAAEAAQLKALFKHNIKPIQIHPADGFGPGAFYVDNTISPSVSSVQLHLIDNGYKMMVQIINPKDFDAGEKQAAAFAQQAFNSIKDKSAFKTI
ncbi:MAG TPA: hypothetical protein VNF48_06590 [Gammaproteobacteria bacterium]|nr:hypothetical protein [Gammaproteobacteria bacterium]